MATCAHLEGSMTDQLLFSDGFTSLSDHSHAQILISKVLKLKTQHFGFSGF